MPRTLAICKIQMPPLLYAKIADYYIDYTGVHDPQPSRDVRAIRDRLIVWSNVRVVIGCMGKVHELCQRAVALSFEGMSQPDGKRISRPSMSCVPDDHG